MLNTIAVVQARMNSGRFPGKSLVEIAGMPLLQILLLRLGQAKKLDRVIIATSREKADDAIQALCGKIGIPCVRGSENDVLDRFLLTLEQYPADSVVRICADNPLTDPALIDDLIHQFRYGVFDYAYNNLPECGYPDGVGAEIVAAETLRRTARETSDLSDREHVTLYIKRHPEAFRILKLQAPSHLQRPEIRLDVDYTEDLQCLHCLCEALPTFSRPFWTTEEIIETIDAHPEIVNLRKRIAA